MSYQQRILFLTFFSTSCSTHTNLQGMAVHLKPPPSLQETWEKLTPMLHRLYEERFKDISIAEKMNFEQYGDRFSKRLSV